MNAVCNTNYTHAVAIQQVFISEVTSGWSVSPKENLAR